MMTRKFLVILAAAAAFGAGTASYAASYTPADTVSSATADAGRSGKHMDRLGLTGEQKAGMKALREKYEPVIKPLFKQMMDKRGELETLMRAATVDEAAIRAKVAEMSGIHADMAVQRAHKMNEMRAILTPEQLQKIEKGKADKKGGRKGCGPRGHKDKGGWMDGGDEMM